MEKFTAEETDRINVLYGTGFKGEINEDDIKLISRFEYMKAYNDIETQNKENEISTKLKRESANAQSIFEQALSNMQELQQRALSRYEKLEKRERPTIEDAQKDEFNVVQRSAVTHNGK